MQHLILGLLLGGPLSLYDVHKRFGAGISLFYAASFGSIQRALRQLDEQGLVTATEVADSRRRKKLYELTDDGREAWRAWMLAPISGSNAEPTMLAKVYLLGHVPVPERSAYLATIRARIAEDADALVALATTLDARELSEDVREIYQYQRATLDYGLRSHALALEWLAELERSA